MRQIEPIAAYIPYMVAVGNHEDNYDYSHYINRFRMPLYSTSSNMWYSWNIGLVHFIAYSTETIFYDADGYVLNNKNQCPYKQLLTSEQYHN